MSSQSRLHAFDIQIQIDRQADRGFVAVVAHRNSTAQPPYLGKRPSNSLTPQTGRLLTGGLGGDHRFRVERSPLRGVSIGCKRPSTAQRCRAGESWSTSAFARAMC